MQQSKVKLKSGGWLAFIYRYLDPNENESYLKEDQIYAKLMKILDIFMAALPLEDKNLFSKMISEYYHKHFKAIQSKSQSDTELLFMLLMALLVDQNSDIKELEKVRARQL